MGLNLLARLFQTQSSDALLGGRYKIISQLGAGGFGQTFLAEDVCLPGRPRCAIKQLKPEVVDMSNWLTARRLFDREASVLAQLGSHNQIPRLFAHFEENHEFYLAQEYIEGVSLSQELVAGQPWPETQVIALLEDLLQVLAFVHQQRVIHRDINPSNLIRRHRDNKIVLIDFGAVKKVSAQLIDPQTGQTRTISIGTQGYMPKEQLGGNPRFSSDIYAVGMVGIQALTGVHPRQFKTNPITGDIEWQNRALHASPKLAAILERMVHHEFRSRYPTAVEALKALQGLTQSSESNEPRQLSSRTPIPVATSPVQHQLVPTLTKPKLGQRQSIKLWHVLTLTVLTVVTTIFFLKLLFFSQRASQTKHHSRVPSPAAAHKRQN